MLSEEQARAGLEYLRELRARNNYWGAMWVPEIERLQGQGLPLTSVVAGCLDVAAKWFTQAGLGSGRATLGRAHGGAYPTGVDGDLGSSLFRLFEVTEQHRNWHRYGYHGEGHAVGAKPGRPHA